MDIKIPKDVSLLLLRLATAFIFIFHGWGKALDWAGASDKFVGMNFPGFLGGPVGVIEVVAGIALIVGFQTKWSAIALLVIIIGALLGVQVPGAMAEGGFTVTKGFERDLMVTVATIAIIAFGPGAYSMQKE